MSAEHAKLTVYFDDPFWAALVERGSGDDYEVARYVFGQEPSLPEIEAFILSPAFARLRFAKADPADVPKAAVPVDNPKRRQREAARAISTRGISTKAQDVLKASYEEGKKQAASKRKQRKDDRAEERWQSRREKARKKKRGH